MQQVEILEKYDQENLRITLIRADGAVLFDTESEERLENHMNRPEVRAALRQGSGSDERTSATTGRASYYYALLLDNGDVLRVSMDTNSRSDLFCSALPAILVCCIAVVLLSVLLSLFLTKSLVRPVVQMGQNLDAIDQSVPYPELQPFVRPLYGIGRCAGKMRACARNSRPMSATN